jgi:Protein of unknown function (DUF3891)
MIVRTLYDRLQLITQPDHAHLAGRIMEHCVPLAARPRNDAVLHAIVEHDNGWEEEDAAPTVDPESGVVVDFVTAPLSVRHRVWPRACKRLADDPWAAALVAQHAITVYDRFRSDAEWTGFFAEMAATRDALLRDSGLPLDELLSDYAFVRLADLISLTFCTGWTDPQHFREWTVTRFDTRVVVAPDLFGSAVIPFAIGAREIPDRRFRADAELREALSDAKTLTLRGEVVGNDG